MRGDLCARFLADYPSLKGVSEDAEVILEELQCDGGLVERHHYSRCGSPRRAGGRELPWLFVHVAIFGNAPAALYTRFHKGLGPHSFLLRLLLGCFAGRMRIATRPVRAPDAVAVYLLATNNAGRRVESCPAGLVKR